METKINVNRENQYVEIQISFQIPFCDKRKFGSDYDIDKRFVDMDAYAFDVIGTFSKRIIESLERRKQAMCDLLVKHINDIDYADEFSCISFVRKNGSRKIIYTSSIKTIEDAIVLLKKSNQKDFLSNQFMVGETLEALMNDTVQDHSDEGTITYSELVSILRSYLVSAQLLHSQK